MDFFDDDVPSQGSKREPTTSSRRPERRRPDRRRTRIQRIVILAAILFVVVFGLAWWARSCQHNRKVASYRDYFASVTTAIDDSEAQGKALTKLVKSPTKYSKKELTAKLDEFSSKQQEIAARADRLEPPDTLADEQAVFAEGMKVRAEGFKLFRSTVASMLGKKGAKVSQLAVLGGYFTGPDAYYMSQVYTQARNIMNDQGVTDVTVPTADYYLATRTFDAARLQAMVSAIASSAKLTGIHGVGLESVTAQPGGTVLSKGKTTNVAADPALAFDVKVQNGGNSAEKDVLVTVSLKPPGGTAIEASKPISIPAGQTVSVTITGLAIPNDALSKVSTLIVKAGPVPGEQSTANNSATYKILLQLQ